VASQRIPALSCEIFDSRGDRFTVFKPDSKSRFSQTYLSIAEETSRNVLWLGTQYSGLHRLDLTTGQLKVYRSSLANPHALRDDMVQSVYVDASNEVWAGTQNGLSSLDERTGTFTSYGESEGLSGRGLRHRLELAIFAR
jgi:ligand-binding sensor domain-containing protein